MISTGGAHEPQSGTVERMKIQQQLFGVKGMSWKVSDSKNSTNPVLFYTQGELFSWHKSGHTHGGETDEALAYWSNVYWSLRDAWEIYTYIKQCPEPLKGEVNDGKVHAYPFARITRRFSLYSHFTLERYDCDGSLTEVWDIVPKYWLAALHHWVIREPSGRLVGTIDEKASVLRTTFNAEFFAELDKMLVAHVVIFAGKPRKSSSSSSGSSGRKLEDNGNSRGKAVAAAVR